AAQRMHLGITAAVGFHHVGADDRRFGIVAVHRNYPWNTTASSTTITRCMLSRLEKILITPTAKPVPRKTSGGMKNASLEPAAVAILPNHVAAPMPRPKPIMLTSSA